MKNKTFIIIMVIIALSGVSFYWFEYRPSQVKSDCQKEVDQEYDKLYDNYFQKQMDGSIVYKARAHTTVKLEDFEAVKKAAQNIYEPCLQRHGL